MSVAELDFEITLVVAKSIHDPYVGVEFGHGHSRRAIVAKPQRVEP